MIARQLLVGVGIVVAIAVLWLAAAGPLHPLITLPPDDRAQRLAFAAKWLLVPGYTLFAGIGMVAARRFFSSDAIDGTRTPQSASLEINLRYNQNTLEQVVLVTVAWPLLALYLPTDQLGLIPVLAVLFGFGRAAFLDRLSYRAVGARVRVRADLLSHGRRADLAAREGVVTLSSRRACAVR